MKIEDTFSPLSPGALKLDGLLGKAIGRSIEARLKKVDYRHLVDPFRYRNEDDGVWRCEFWGKITRSAIRSWRALPDDQLLKIINDTVGDMLSTQTQDGCISSYPAEKQTTRWDVWGRKYVLLTLCRYCNTIKKDPAVINAIAACLDHLIAQVGPNAKFMTESGEHLGMAPSSILGAVMQVYWLTGEKRFLDYANWIVNEGGSPVFKQVMSGESPAKIGNGKAYEMTSCIEGLLELYRENGNPAILDAVIRYFEKVRDEEIFITGVGGLKDACGEFWDNGAVNQVRQDKGGLGETCVTTTYIRFCLNLLRQTGDPRIADEIENSLYNGTLGEMVPDGSWWMHLNPTPLSASSTKKPATDQIEKCSSKHEKYYEDCCLAQGPEALATAPLFAVMQAKDAIVVNLYEPCFAKEGNGISLEISGSYPDDEDAKIKVICKDGQKASLKLRMPSWSPKTSVTVAGREIATTPGTYCTITREWKNGDIIDIKFQMPLTAKTLEGLTALKRGPIVLARDSRLGDVNQPYNNPKTAVTVQSISGIRRVYKLDDNSLVCDYASAGNTFDEHSKLRVFC